MTRSAHARSATASRGALVNALRVTSILAVLVIVWQGVSAGTMISGDSAALTFHQAGALGTHITTGLAAIATFLLWRANRGPIWPTVLAAVVFVATFVQAQLGHGPMWAHVPGALVLMLGSAALLAWAFFRAPGERPAGARY